EVEVFENVIREVKKAGVFLGAQQRGYYLALLASHTCTF
ncbi:MAG: hypothetical protein JWQ40_2774, partial [Segetibacter sp.]|nr:hypothetical protein [Segetibacter sp.]